MNDLKCEVCKIAIICECGGSPNHKNDRCMLEDTTYPQARMIGNYEFELIHLCSKICSNKQNIINRRKDDEFFMKKGLKGLKRITLDDTTMYYDPDEMTREEALQEMMDSNPYCNYLH